MAIPSWKLFPALVCGNTCVIKPAEDTPLSTINIVQALVDAGLPKGVVNIVTGFGPEAGAPMLTHPDVRAISFTGSSEVGRMIGEVAARFFQNLTHLAGHIRSVLFFIADQDLACPKQNLCASRRGCTPPVIKGLGGRRDRGADVIAD